LLKSYGQVPQMSLLRHLGMPQLTCLPSVKYKFLSFRIFVLNIFVICIDNNRSCSIIPSYTCANTFRYNLTGTRVLPPTILAGTSASPHCHYISYVTVDFKSDYNVIFINIYFFDSGTHSTSALIDSNTHEQAQGSYRFL